MGRSEERIEELSRLMQSESDQHALRLHVSHILESPAFTSSKRSGQFLQYVVDKAIARDADSLKERTIGVEVFNRSPDYDTGEDAVVRVTASDVRRRLAQHYTRDGFSSKFRISLPPGGYAPEIVRSEAEHSLEAENEPPTVETRISVSPAHRAATSSIIKRPAFLWTLLGFALFTLGGVYLQAKRTTSTVDQSPWNLLFADRRPLYVVLSDPDLNEIQLLTGHSVSISDYANGRLGCDSLPKEASAICKTSFSGDKVAAVDATAIAKISELASSFRSSIEPHTAREIRLTDLQGDRSLLLVGSARANPWVELFRDKFDFDVVHDDQTNLQIVRNLHPKPGELNTYLPTAGPHGTGENYAVITFLRNPNNQHFVMLLAGATHEGTDAAVSLATDPNRLAELLSNCGLQPTQPHQVLLKLTMMAGSPLVVHEVACHALRN